MTHTYAVAGMTCGSCEAGVKSSLLKMPHVTGAEVSKAAGTATVHMNTHIPLTTLQEALAPKYTITNVAGAPVTEMAAEADTRTWFATYKPLLVLFAYIGGLTILLAGSGETFNWMQAMNIFMAGFFLAFSFFKMLDLEGFASSYAMYDVVAKRLPAWGYAYPFVELLLGIAYATAFRPLLTNTVTFVVMTVSLIGVLQSVLNKRKIKCACLGSVFNLPMSTVTIAEDSLMILMSAGMIYTLL